MGHVPHFGRNNCNTSSGHAVLAPMWQKGDDGLTRDFLGLASEVNGEGDNVVNGGNVKHVLCSKGFSCDYESDQLQFLDGFAAAEFAAAASSQTCWGVAD